MSKKCPSCNQIYTNDYEGYYNVDSVKKLTRNR